MMVAWLSYVFNHHDQYFIPKNKVHNILSVGFACFSDLVLECLKRGKDRVSHYLQSSSEQKLVEIVQREFPVTQENLLLEKENCRALLRDHEHVMDEGTALVQLTEEAANNWVTDLTLAHDNNK